MGGGDERPPAGPRPVARFVLLGASNLTRGISTLLAAARQRAGGPVELFAAMGYGRSYGMRSRLFWRCLPGIVDCGLWGALRGRPPLPTYALLTDIGNDIMYGADPTTIAGWVAWCLDRLVDARTVLTGLPLRTVERLQPWRYAVVRGVLFSGRDISLSQAVSRARDLNDRLCGLAARRGLTVVDPDPQWYGIDPIHIRLRQRSSAWPAILAPLGEGRTPVRLRGSLLRWLHLSTLRPQCCWLLGRQWGVPQPAARLGDGSQVFLY